MKSTCPVLFARNLFCFIANWDGLACHGTLIVPFHAIVRVVTPLLSPHVKPVFIYSDS